MASVTLVQPGAAKANGSWPYTICIIANPWIESPQSSGIFIADPIIEDRASFDERAQYIQDSIFGRLPGQAEDLFGQFSEDFRVICIFDADLPRKTANALVAHDNTNIVVARQDKFARFLRSYTLPEFGKIRADVAFAVTASATHDRSSAYYTMDNDELDGTSFEIDGDEFFHRPDNLMPGAVALHIKASSIVALHEFGHAASSWTNGMVTDLYVDEGEGINKRRGRPIIGQFCSYANETFASATDRWTQRPYPADWTSYHAEHVVPQFPVVMDDFWQADGRQSEKCRFDSFTNRFLLDRISTIMSR